MWRAARQYCCALFSLTLFACGGQPAAPPVPPPLPQVSGTLVVESLVAPVRVVRDRWGIPHIYAENQNDLFVAQGFVQAQDRLFQMDLWRRSVQGRLAQVLGANFVGRDAMTRGVQYRGDLASEWASYGDDTKAIASAFVRGVNAWVTIAREQVPEEFRLAGWRPEFWAAEDLLNRTDAFLASASAIGDVMRAQLVATVGVGRADDFLPPGRAGKTTVPAGLDLTSVSYVVADELRGVGTRPFFSNAWAIAGDRSGTGAPLLATDPHGLLEHPAARYLVHLVAPGWNVIGATSPWMPGVVVGHNERIAWGITGLDADVADVQDLYVEKANPARVHQIEDRGAWVDTEVRKDPIIVKGRRQPLEFEREYTRHGPVVATDRERNLLFALRWSGSEPGTAGELAALAIDRARSWTEFRDALRRWKLPAATFVYADAEGIGSQTAALIPIRRSWNGALPAPGWSGVNEWNGWRSLDELPHQWAPAEKMIASANGNVSRTTRIGEVLSSSRRLGADDFERLQHDTLAWKAVQLVPLLARVRADRADVERAREQLMAWDRRLTADSAAATLYVIWERTLLRQLAERRIPPALLDDYVARAPEVLVPALTLPSGVWFDGQAPRERDRLLVAALGAAVDDLQKLRGSDGAAPLWGRMHVALFQHPLAVTEAARRRLNVGPFERAGYRETVMSTGGSGLEQKEGATFSAIFDVADWDRSTAVNAPGQSGAPGSAHFADLAKLWAAGEHFALPFSSSAVQASAETELTLTPRR